MNTTTATGTRFIATCKNCGKVRSYVGGKVDRYGMDVRWTTCTCGKAQKAKAVKGTYSERVVCSEKCTAAASHKCSCSCGGENHGADFGGLR